MSYIYQPAVRALQSYMHLEITVVLVCASINQLWSFASCLCLVVAIYASGDRWWTHRLFEGLVSIQYPCTWSSRYVVAKRATVHGWAGCSCTCSIHLPVLVLLVHLFGRHSSAHDAWTSSIWRWSNLPPLYYLPWTDTSYLLARLSHV